jgi:hypothetical protein
MTNLPSVFHITHWKAGSQWVRAVLAAAAPQRIVPLPDEMSLSFNGPSDQGGIYTPLYLRADRFRRVVPADPLNRAFVVIRDPRDTLVSWYFSLKYSHPENFAGIRDTRAMLQNAPTAEGMAILLREHLFDAVAIQSTWVEDGATIFRYEDLVADPHEAFGKMLNFCGISPPEATLRTIVEANDFRAVSGREPGEEDVQAHLRKGIVGDWQNHFCRRIKALFKSRYGEALIRMGYERDGNW